MLTVFHGPFISTLFLGFQRKRAERFVSFNDLMNLLNDLHKTNPGPIQRALREADLDKTHEVRIKKFPQRE